MQCATAVLREVLESKRTIQRLWAGRVFYNRMAAARPLRRHTCEPNRKRVHHTRAEASTSRDHGEQARRSVAGFKMASGEEEAGPSRPPRPSAARFATLFQHPEASMPAAPPQRAQLRHTSPGCEVAVMREVRAAGTERPRCLFTPTPWLPACAPRHQPSSHRQQYRGCWLHLGELDALSWSSCQRGLSCRQPRYAVDCAPSQSYASAGH